MWARTCKQQTKCPQYSIFPEFRPSAEMYVAFSWVLQKDHMASQSWKLKDTSFTSSIVLFYVYVVFDAQLAIKWIKWKSLPLKGSHRLFLKLTHFLSHHRNWLGPQTLWHSDLKPFDSWLNLNFKPFWLLTWHQFQALWLMTHLGLQTFWLLTHRQFQTFLTPDSTSVSNLMTHDSTWTSNLLTHDLT